MIIINLNGGLGNQLFQYALGRQISIRNKSELKFDTNYYLSSENRSLKLDCFNIDVQIATKVEINRFIKKNKLAKKIFNFLENIKPLETKTYYQEKDICYDINIDKLKSQNLYLEGYWQSEKYFIDIEGIIKKEISLKNNIDDKYLSIIKKINETNSVSIHFRRTDYTDSKHSSIYHSLENSYYQNAIDLINKKVKNPSYFIFSDDINWVKENIELPSLSTIVSEAGLADHEEMIIMSKCKHNIIANSSFSRWGAWLNSNSDKIVIAPKKWFKPESMNTKDLIPNSWIKIK